MTGPVITPSVVGKSQRASKFALQVDTASSQSNPTWLTVFGVFNFQPNVDYTMQDNSDYDSDSWGSDFPTQRKWNAAVSLRDKLYGGVQDPGQAALQTAADGLEQVHVRFFDRKGGAEAYEGWAYVQWQPQGGDVTAESTTNVTLNGQGEREKISNPVAVASKPVLGSATPPGAKEGELVTIKGSNLTNVTGVDFGITAADDFTVVTR